MFKITPVGDTAEALALSEGAGLPYFKGAFYYKMFDMESGELMGFSVFEIHKNMGEILALYEVEGKDDFEAMFILGRQTLNFIDLCGTHLCKATDTYASERMLSAIGFQKQESGDFLIHLEGMFDGHCGNH